MIQGVVVLAVVTLAAAWLGWRALPARVRQKITGKKGGGCGCGCG
jgi:hypothetical protein